MKETKTPHTKERRGTTKCTREILNVLLVTRGTRRVDGDQSTTGVLTTGDGAWKRVGRVTRLICTWEGRGGIKTCSERVAWKRVGGLRSYRSTWTKTEMVTSVVAALANEWSELRCREARGNLARVVSDVVQLEASGARMQLFFSSSPSWNW